MAITRQFECDWLLSPIIDTLLYSVKKVNTDNNFDIALFLDSDKCISTVIHKYLLQSKKILPLKS